MGNICDCLNNESDAEGLVPPVTRDSRYGGLRDPVPETTPAEVVTSPTSPSPLPPVRPIAAVHPQTHVSRSPPVAKSPPVATSAEISSAGASIEKVTLPPPPTKSPVKKTSKEGPGVVARPKVESPIVDDPLGGATITDEPAYSTIQPKLASPKSSAPPASPLQPTEQLPPQAFFKPNVSANAQPEDESFTEFVKDRTKSGGSPVNIAPIDVQPVSSAPIVPVPIMSAPIAPVVSAPVSASPAVIDVPPSVEKASFDLPAASSLGKEEARRSGDFTEYLDNFVAQTKKTIAETVTTPKHAEAEATLSLSTEKPATMVPEEQMSIVDLDSSPSPMEKSPSPDDFKRQKAASNANVEKVPVQNSYKQMTEILTIPGAKEKDEKESSPFEIGSSESELSKPDLVPMGKSLADELSEFGGVVDANANIDVARTDLIVAEALDDVAGELLPDMFETKVSVSEIPAANVSGVDIDAKAPKGSPIVDEKVAEKPIVEIPTMAEPKEDEAVPALYAVAVGEPLEEIPAMAAPTEEVVEELVAEIPLLAEPAKVVPEVDEKVPIVAETKMEVPAMDEKMEEPIVKIPVMAVPPKEVSAVNVPEIESLAAPVVEESVMEIPVMIESPKSVSVVDEQKVDKPVMVESLETPAAEESAMETPVITESPKKVSVTDEPKLVEVSAVKEPVVKNPIVAGSPKKVSVVGEPLVDKPVVDELLEAPAAEESAVETPVITESPKKVSVTDEPELVEVSAVKEPVVKNPIVAGSPKKVSVVDEPLVDKPVVDESLEAPVMEEPVVEIPVMAEPPKKVSLMDESEVVKAVVVESPEATATEEPAAIPVMAELFALNEKVPFVAAFTKDAPEVEGPAIDEPAVPLTEAKQPEFPGKAIVPEAVGIMEAEIDLLMAEDLQSEPVKAPLGPEKVDVFSVSGDHAKIAIDKPFQSPAVIDAIELELTNEDSPRLTVGETLTGDLNVNEVSTHDKVNSQSSAEMNVVSAMAGPEPEAQEPLLDLRREVSGSISSEDVTLEPIVDLELKEVHPSVSEIAFDATVDESVQGVIVTKDIPSVGQDLFELDSSTRDVEASVFQTSGAIFAGDVLQRKQASLEASLKDDTDASAAQFVASDLIGDFLQSSTEELAAAAIVAGVEERAFAGVSVASTGDKSFESSLELPVPLVASTSSVDIVGEPSRDIEESLEKSVNLLASDLIGNVLRASTEELAASSIVADVSADAATQLVFRGPGGTGSIEDVDSALESSSESSPDKVEVNSEPGNLESSIEVIHSTPEPLSTSTAAASVNVGIPDHSAANDKAALNVEQVLPASLTPEVSPLRHASAANLNAFSPGADQDEMESWLSSGAAADHDEFVLISEKDGADEDDVVIGNEGGAESSSATNAAPIADLRAALPDVLQAANVLDADDVKTDLIDYSDEEDFDEDDEFAKIMATARRMDAKAKERGDSDSIAAGLNFGGGGGGGDDDFLNRLAKKISKPSESEETGEVAVVSSAEVVADSSTEPSAALMTLLDTTGSDGSPVGAANVSLNTTDASYFSAKSELEATLVEEQSLLDFDDAFNQGITSGMLSPAPTSISPVANDVPSVPAPVFEDDQLI